MSHHTKKKKGGSSSKTVSWISGWVGWQEGGGVCVNGSRLQYHGGIVPNDEVMIVLCELQKNWGGSGRGVFQDAIPAFALSD
jgi:hypothetical protein